MKRSQGCAPVEPGALASDVADSGHHLASIVTFPNCYEVLLSLDIDLLDVFTSRWHGPSTRATRPRSLSSALRAE